MYEKFENYLYDFLNENVSQDFWYDVASVKASEMLEKFLESDWEKLVDKLKEQPMEFKRKLVYCIGDNKSNYEFSIILSLINTDDDVLFEACVDSLRGLLDLKNIFQIDEIVVNRIKNQIPFSSRPVQLVLKDILEKLTTRQG